MAGLWLNKMCELMVHHYNEASAMSRAAAAKGYGLDANLFSHPYPGSTNVTMLVPSPEQLQPPPEQQSTAPPATVTAPAPKPPTATAVQLPAVNGNGNGWLKTALMIGSLCLGGGTGAAITAAIVGRSATVQPTLPTPEWPKAPAIDPQRLEVKVEGSRLFLRQPDGSWQEVPLRRE